MYADYEFYTTAYFGNAITEGDFPRLSERASDYIRAATGGISDKVDGWQLEAVKKCSCAIADILLDEEIMNAGAFSGEASVSSETVGSWSRSYNAITVAASDVEYINKRKWDALALYLGNLAVFATMFKVQSFPCVHRAVRR